MTYAPDLLAVFAVSLVAVSCHSTAGIIPPSQSACGISNPQMIDDMEDGDAAICAYDGRIGAWYSLGDGTEGTLSPAPNATFVMSSIPDGRGVSRFAAHLSGSGFTTWAFMGFDLNNSGVAARPYDASAVAGIHFFMKADESTAARGLQVSFSTSDTVPLTRGGDCPSGSVNCDQEFFSPFSSPVPNQWQELTILYQNAGQYLPPASRTLKLNPAKLIAAHFGPVNPNAPFDFWIDDVSFFYH